jgi:hypothetical protein
MREEAMTWWNTLISLEKEVYCSLCFSESIYSDLTEGEIEEIYKTFFKTK